jgi:hypothetical protein
MNESQPHKPIVIFFDIPRAFVNSVRNLGTLMSVWFQESVRAIDVLILTLKPPLR